QRTPRHRLHRFDDAPRALFESIELCGQDPKQHARAAARQELRGKQVTIDGFHPGVRADQDLLKRLFVATRRTRVTPVDSAPNCKGLRNEAGSVSQREDTRDESVGKALELWIES